MDKEAAEIIAAALNNVATSSAIQAETNAVLAAQMERMTRTVQAHQFVVDRKVSRMVDVSKEHATRMLKESARVIDERRS